MTFDRAVVAEMKMPYAIEALGAGPAPDVVCATEDHGPLVRIPTPYREALPLAPGPGGCMSLAVDPAAPRDLYAVMGCFVGYKFQGGAIYRLRDGGAPEAIAPLPFAHRIGFTRKGGRPVLLAASLAADKRDPADWSQPGAVYALDARRLEPGAALEPVVPGLHRNHGFLLTALDGRRCALIAAAEGLLAIDLEDDGPAWPVRTLLPQEVSEAALLDLDGDGAPELVTIEPFHGTALRAYRRAGAGWTPFFEAELAFGHCLLGCRYQGRPSVLVSSRAGGKELLLFAFDGDPARPRRVVVDEGAGAANFVVVPHQGRDLILSANQAAGQIVRYTPR